MCPLTESASESTGPKEANVLRLLASKLSRFWVLAVQRLGNWHRRFLAACFAVVGPRAAYRVTDCGAGIIYGMLEPLRLRSEGQCRAALRGKVPDRDIARIARQSFINRARNLTDLLLAPRLLHAATFERYGGKIPQPYLDELLTGQLHRQPTILVTGYVGSFDLLSIFLGYNGIRACAVYLPHSNKGFDKFRLNVRGKSGCELVPVDHALPRLDKTLSEGGTVALLADHHVEDRGVGVTFLGLDTRVTRSIGLLAWRHEANVVVAGIQRCEDAFHFRWVISDVIYYKDAPSEQDPVEFITRRYVTGLERLILADPTQYLWAYARWGEDFARLASGVTNTE